MNKTKKKNLKGMTLIEIIVSLAVLAVMTLLLVQASSTINMYIRSANKVNKRVAEQAPIAEIGYTDAAHRVSEDDVEIIVGRGKTETKLKGKAYEVEDESLLNENEFGGNLNMQFIVLEEVSTVPEEESP